jgi:hypothetical protein
MGIQIHLHENSRFILIFQWFSKFIWKILQKIVEVCNFDKISSEFVIQYKQYKKFQIFEL